MTNLCFCKLLICFASFTIASCVSMQEYQTLQRQVEQLKNQPTMEITDADEDGVIDAVDQELDSPKGARVDTRGRVLDSDGDNVPDYKDQEPYSARGYPVDDNGVAQKNAVNTLNEEDVNRIFDARFDQIMSAPPAFLVPEIAYPDFPWTPPAYSKDALLPVQQYFKGAQTFGEIDQRISKALKSAGFPDQKNYFQLHTGEGSGGFALISPLERIDSRGNPISGERFDGNAGRLSGAGMLASLLSFWRADIPGHYRIFVFLFTDHYTWPRQSLITRQDALSQDLTGGSPFLHRLIARRELSSQATCRVLIYEFEQRDNESQSRSVTLPQTDGIGHLRKAGILQQLLL